MIDGASLVLHASDPLMLTWVHVLVAAGLLALLAGLGAFVHWRTRTLGRLLSASAMVQTTRGPIDCMIAAIPPAPAGARTRGEKQPQAGLPHPAPTHRRGWRAFHSLKSQARFIQSYHAESWALESGCSQKLDAVLAQHFSLYC